MVASDHLGLGVIGLTANIGLAYTLKFLWAPVFDEVAAAVLGAQAGLAACVQAALVVAIAGLGLSDPAAHGGRRWRWRGAGVCFGQPGYPHRRLADRDVRRRGKVRRWPAIFGASGKRC